MYKNPHWKFIYNPSTIDSTALNVIYLKVIVGHMYILHGRYMIWKVSSIISKGTAILEASDLKSKPLLKVHHVSNTVKIG